MPSFLLRKINLFLFFRCLTVTWLETFSKNFFFCCSLTQKKKTFTCVYTYMRLIDRARYITHAN